MRDGLVVRRAVQGAHVLLIAAAAYAGALAVRAAVALWFEPAAMHYELPAPQRTTQTTPPRARRQQSDIAAIFRRNIFGSEPIAALPDEPAPGAPLELKLRGTARIDGRDYAVFEDPSAGMQDVFSVGERVFDGPKLVSVDEHHAVLLYQGRRRTIELSSEEEQEDSSPAGAKAGAEGGIRKTGKDAYLVDRREVEHTIDNLNTVVTQMRAIPYLRDGKSLGFRVFNIHPGSIFERMGLHNGDVIQRVNGTELTSPANAMGLLDGIADAEEIRVELLRNNRPQVLTYRIQ